MAENVICCGCIFLPPSKKKEMIITFLIELALGLEHPRGTFLLLVPQKKLSHTAKWVLFVHMVRPCVKTIIQPGFVFLLQIVLWLSGPFVFCPSFILSWIVGLTQCFFPKIWLSNANVGAHVSSRLQINTRFSCAHLKNAKTITSNHGNKCNSLQTTMNLQISHYIEHVILKLGFELI